jgi:hypothetical protein
MNGSDRRGLVLGLALVVTMACGALALGLGGAFSDVPCSAPARLTVQVGPSISGEPRTANVYRLTPPDLSAAQVVGFSNALGIGAPKATPVGWTAGDRSRIGFLELTRYPVGWSVDAQPARHAPAPFARRTDHPGSRATARRAALDVMAAFGVDARSWAVSVGPVEDSEYPAREVTLVPPLLARVSSDTGLYDLGWTVEVWKDGSITSIQGTLTTADAIPTRLDSPREVIRPFARSKPDPYHAEFISIDVARHGNRIRVRPAPEFRLSRSQQTSIRCRGEVQGGYLTTYASSGGYEGIGAIGLRPLVRFDPLIDTTFDARRERSGSLAIVVPDPAIDEAFLVPTYVFTGPSNLTFRGKPYSYTVVELAVPIDRVAAR